MEIGPPGCQNSPHLALFPCAVDGQGRRRLDRKSHDLVGPQMMRGVSKMVRGGTQLNLNEVLMELEEILPPGALERQTHMGTHLTT